MTSTFVFLRCCSVSTSVHATSLDAGTLMTLDVWECVSKTLDTHMVSAASFLGMGVCHLQFDGNPSAWEDYRFDTHHLSVIFVLPRRLQHVHPCVPPLNCVTTNTHVQNRYTWTMSRICWQRLSFVPESTKNDNLQILHMWSSIGPTQSHSFLDIVSSRHWASSIAKVMNSSSLLRSPNCYMSTKSFQPAGLSRQQARQRTKRGSGPGGTRGGGAGDA